MDVQKRGKGKFLVDFLAALRQALGCEIWPERPCFPFLRHPVKGVCKDLEITYLYSIHKL